MKTAISALALCAALGLSAVASAQVPSGVAGSDAKGNAPLKRAHTINDGGARRGRNSFTEGQARTHILKAGYQSVTGLAKGKDGVWRGTAMKNGASVDVGMDFKGNVSEGAAVQAQGAAMSSTSTSSTVTGSSQGASMASAGGGAATSSADQGAAPSGKATAHPKRHRRHVANRCATPTPDGAACSGVDRNRNGVSDKEDRAIKSGAHP